MNQKQRAYFYRRVTDAFKSLKREINDRFEQPFNCLQVYDLSSDIDTSNFPPTIKKRVIACMKANNVVRLQWRGIVKDVDKLLEKNDTARQKVVYSLEERSKVIHDRVMIATSKQEVIDALKDIPKLKDLL